MSPLATPLVLSLLLKKMGSSLRKDSDMLALDNTTQSTNFVSIICKELRS